MTPQYRTPGHPCGKSITYMTSLLEAGWPSNVVDILKENIRRFENACAFGTYEEAVETYDGLMPPEHEPFFAALHRYINSNDRAIRRQMLQSAAQDNKHKDFMAAQNLIYTQLNRGDDVDVGTETNGKGQTVINFNVKPAKQAVKVTRGTAST